MITIFVKLHAICLQVINLCGVSTNKTIVCFITMQTYKEQQPVDNFTPRPNLK